MLVQCKQHLVDCCMQALPRMTHHQNCPLVWTKHLQNHLVAEIADVVLDHFEVQAELWIKPRVKAAIGRIAMTGMGLRNSIKGPKAA